MKVLICDYVGNSAQWLDQFTIRSNVEVVGTISPSTNQTSRALLAENSWDYLLIFEQGARPFFLTMTQFMNISPDRVIFALDWASWAAHPVAVFALINPQQGGVAYRMLSFNIGRQLNYFITCTTADDIHYIATSKDDAIIKPTYFHRNNYAVENMKLFHELVQIFYKIDNSEGLFLDLGANIGTTGVYFIKKLTPNLKLLAFEPGSENFKLLRANLILNDIYEKAIVENLGLGSGETEQTLYVGIVNPGGCGMFGNYLYQPNKPSEDVISEDAPSEKIKIISLDKYFADKNLSANDIKYIWIDTEGFEAQVLVGATELLTVNPAPVFMEFNPKWWQKSGCYEKMMNLLTNLYSGYVWISEVQRTGKINVYNIEKLWEFQTSTDWIGSMGDIFLIKKS